MGREITLAELDQATAAHVDAKKRARAKSATAADQEQRKTTAEELVAVRSAYRLQEEAAGRRGGLIQKEG
ncbi:MAG: hypothetical protein LC798_05440 [Chloroflexi bacterium]|nr:hypothetical protein [Chloroflexota bacterium]